MKLTELLRDDDAVSPVIGVILMVAITVILAAVIGTFVLGLGGQVSQTTPSASFSFDFSSNGSNYDVTATHEGGTSLTADNTDTITLVAETPGDLQTYDPSTSGSFTAGDSLTDTSGTIAPNDEVRVTWASANGDTSATLGRQTAPS